MELRSTIKTFIMNTVDLCEHRDPHYISQVFIPLSLISQFDLARLMVFIVFHSIGRDVIIDRSRDPKHDIELCAPASILSHPLVNLLQFPLEGQHPWQFRK